MIYPLVLTEYRNGGDYCILGIGRLVIHQVLDLTAEELSK